MNEHNNKFTSDIKQQENKLDTAYFNKEMDFNDSAGSYKAQADFWKEQYQT